MSLAVDQPDVRLLFDGAELLVAVYVVQGGGGGEGGCWGACWEVTGAVRGLPRASLAQVVPHLLVQARVRPVEIIPVPVRGGAQLVLLLGLHPPVLEPDLDLPLGQPQVVSDLYPPPPGEVAVEVELLNRMAVYL